MTAPAMRAENDAAMRRTRKTLGPVLTPDEFYRKIEAAMKIFNSMTREQQREMMEQQRRSWAKQDMD